MAGTYSQDELLLAILVELRVLNAQINQMEGGQEDLADLRLDEETPVALSGNLSSSIAVA